MVIVIIALSVIIISKLEMLYKVYLKGFWCFWVFVYLALQYYEVFAGVEHMWHCSGYAILLFYYFVFPLSGQHFHRNFGLFF